MGHSASTLVASRASIWRLSWQHVVDGVVAVTCLLRPLVSRPQQLPPLPNDGIEQLRRERMRAHLWHDDLRISARRLL